MRQHSKVALARDLDLSVNFLLLTLGFTNHHTLLTRARSLGTWIVSVLEMPLAHPIFLTRACTTVATREACLQKQQHRHLTTNIHMNLLVDALLIHHF